MPNLLKIWPQLSQAERYWLDYAINREGTDTHSILLTDIEDAKRRVRETYVTWDSDNWGSGKYRLSGAGRLYKKLLEASDG